MHESAMDEELALQPQVGGWRRTLERAGAEEVALGARLAEVGRVRRGAEAALRAADGDEAVDVELADVSVEQAHESRMRGELEQANERVAMLEGELASTRRVQASCEAALASLGEKKAAVEDDKGWTR